MSNNNKKEAVSQGIRSLLGNMNADLKSSGILNREVIEQTTSVNLIPIEQIEANPGQPRKDFDEQALKELSDSIRIHGIIQPLTVSMVAPKRYRLIAGERRLRASKMAGIKELPVYVRKVNDQELLELALLENLQRQDLNAIEIGLSYKRLMEECELTQEQVAERMGKERSTVTNYIRLLKLPPDIVLAVRNGTISMGHARSIIGLEEVDKQMFVYNKIIKEQLSVRQTEELAKSLSEKKPKPGKKAAPPKSNLYQKIEDSLASHFNTRVRLNHQKNGNGTITLEYYSIDELNAILDKMKINVH